MEQKQHEHELMIIFQLKDSPACSSTKHTAQQLQTKPFEFMVLSLFALTPPSPLKFNCVMDVEEASEQMKINICGKGNKPHQKSLLVSLGKWMRFGEVDCIFLLMMPFSGWAKVEKLIYAVKNCLVSVQQSIMVT